MNIRGSGTVSLPCERPRKVTMLDMSEDEQLLTGLEVRTYAHGQLRIALEALFEGGVHGWYNKMTIRFCKVGSVPKVSQEYRDARLLQILAGAQRCFARYGYARATVPRLVKEIGLSHGAIFNYFPSKLDLFVALVLHLNERYRALLYDRGLDAAIQTMSDEDPERLAVVLEAQLRLRQDEQFAQKLAAASRASASPAEAWFAARQAEGMFRDDIAASDLARLATMVMNGVALETASGNSQHVNPLVHMLHDAMDRRR